jgi:hypothetical protein
MDVAGSHAQDVRRSDHPLDAAREKKEEVKGEARGQVDRHAPSEEERQDAKKGLINRIPEEHREKVRGSLFFLGRSRGRVSLTALALLGLAPALQPGPKHKGLFERAVPAGTS